MDKTILILLIALAATAYAAPQGNPNQDITIVRAEENNSIGVGGYHFSYEQSDGQKREETAELKNEGSENEAMAVTGSFEYRGPDGKTYRVDYTADENGFHPTITLV
ncbi:endocuticle structural glycoprotein ABD-5-like [Diachasmimorpha longicaudata]|uniref:endocuticle structural glycoprotein ABD-5-like n=1 Tax=Diachasmimorpha longicaudata TaxID=58733 RepID=UPI0030B8DC80